MIEMPISLHNSGPIWLTHFGVSDIVGKTPGRSFQLEKANH